MSLCFVKPPRSLALIAGIAMLLPVTVFAATLSVGQPRMEGTGWVAPVTLQLAPGENVASMQFDVSLPPNLPAGVSAQISEAAQMAGKQAIFSQTAPGQLRVVVAGLNQSPIPSGTVAQLYLGTPAAAAPPPSIGLQSPVLASPSGERIPVRIHERTEEPEEPVEPETPVQDPAPAPPADPPPAEEDKSADPEAPPADAPDADAPTPRNLFNPLGLANGSDTMDPENKEAGAPRSAGAGVTQGRGEASGKGVTGQSGSYAIYPSAASDVGQSGPLTIATNPNAAARPVVRALPGSTPGTAVSAGNSPNDPMSRERMEVASAVSSVARATAAGSIVSDSNPLLTEETVAEDHLVHNSGLYLVSMFCMFIVGMLSLRFIEALRRPSQWKRHIKHVLDE